MSLQHDEYNRKKRNKKLINIGLAFLIFLILIGTASYISYRPSIRISKVELVGGVLVTQPDVEKETLRYLYGSYFFWLFPRGNSFIYPRGALETFLKNKFKRIDKINIKRKGFTTLVVEINERKPFALWCGESKTSKSALALASSSPEVPADEHCYFMDNNSTIFADAPTFSGDAYFKYYGPVSTSSPLLGSEYISSTTEFTDLADFIASLKTMSVDPTYLSANNENEFTLVLSSGAKIFFDMREPLSKASGNLGALLRTLVTATNTDPTTNIDYIDLRFGNKLYYRLK
ncbi:MAG: hypothetical protein WCK48_01160 [bacterium]